MNAPGGTFDSGTLLANLRGLMDSIALRRHWTLYAFGAAVGHGSRRRWYSR